LRLRLARLGLPWLRLTWLSWLLRHISP
jgi:hypothetical protein